MWLIQSSYSHLFPASGFDSLTQPSRCSVLAHSEALSLTLPLLSTFLYRQMYFIINRQSFFWIGLERLAFHMQWLPDLAVRLDLWLTQQQRGDKDPRIRGLYTNFLTVPSIPVSGLAWWLTCPQQSWLQSPQTTQTEYKVHLLLG